MSLLTPLGLIGTALAIPVLLVHVLRPHRPPAEVSSLLLWSGLQRPVSANQPWQRLRWSALLVLQLLAVALFSIAMARPALLETAPLAEHTVFIIDASGSMAAIDGAPDRLAQAVDRAGELRRTQPTGGITSVVVASARPAVVLQASADLSEFDRAVRSIRTIAGRADFETAFALAEGLVSADRPTGFVLLSDGGLNSQEQSLAPAGLRYEPMGTQATNRAITDLSVTVSPGGLAARVTISNTGGPDASQIVRIDVEGLTVDKREVTLPAGEVVEISFDLPEGNRVSAFLEGEDLLAADNQRYSVAPRPQEVTVRGAAGQDYFIDQLFAAIGNIEFVESPTTPADLAIYSGVPVPMAPDVPFIAIAPPNGAPGIVPSGRVERPVPTFVLDDPVLAGVDVTGLAIADAQVVDVLEGEVLLGAPGVPLLIRGDEGGVPFFYLTFALERSNLPIDVAFPIIGSRMVAELSASDQVSPSLTVGEPITVGSAAGAAVDPRGTRQIAAPGSRGPIADKAGFWTVEEPGALDQVVAVNADVGESRLAPIDNLPDIPPIDRAGPLEVNQALRIRSLIPAVLYALIAILVIELYLSWKSIGVGRRQWYAGIAVRVLVSGLILVALIDPTVARLSGEVTTVFVVDVSDSLNQSGTSQARVWVQSALAVRGDARSAVIEVGGDARVVAPVGALPYEPGSGADTAATNLAQGLRLAESLLTGETRERIVLISDGRPTIGDLGSQVERLASLGIAVDVHLVVPEIVADAAVTLIDAPSSVAVEESYQVTVDVAATVAGEARVDLLQDNSVVDSRLIQVLPGSNPIVFHIDAEETGITHFEARVRLGGDTVAENDSNFAAVTVEGPASVLIVEGVPDNGSMLSDALRSQGVEVDRVAYSEIPTLDDLLGYQAMVLVDIDEPTLARSHVGLIETYVRDLGKGMIVIGGDQSFALGGYTDTDLEALLPVDSEVEDVNREATIAEVLLIDTSESMGACHCRPIEGAGSQAGEPNSPFDGFEMLEGGPNKTDISRSAAARAIGTLNVNDEVGVLAFNAQQNWIIPLQQLPAEDVIASGLSSLSPRGETRIGPALDEAARALRETTRELRHIILFTDGFTPELFGEGPGFDGGTTQLVEQAAALAAEGITVSVVATGEGATPALRQVAEAGNGRFYPGRDLNEIPEIFVKEARLASRSFVNEGRFFPTVVSASEAVQGLTVTPPLLGFVATTPKPTAEVQMEIGEFADPLLASWRVGLGRVTTWTSDGGERWAATWASWEGFAGFWSTVVRDAFPLSASSGQRLEATISSDRLLISLESADPWPVGTSPLARVRSPDGFSEEIRLERFSDFVFAAELPAADAGTYAVGVSLEGPEGEILTISGLASRSYAAEYLLGAPAPSTLDDISSATGGRGQIMPEAAFDPDSLEKGVQRSTYRAWFLLAAALLWPVDVAIRRVRLAIPGKGHRRRLEPSPPTTPRTPTDSQ